MSLLEKPLERQMRRVAKILADKKDDEKAIFLTGIIKFFWSGVTEYSMNRLEEKLKDIEESEEEWN